MVLSEEIRNAVYARDLDRVQSILATVKEKLSEEDVDTLFRWVCSQRRNVDIARVLFTELRIDVRHKPLSLYHQKGIRLAIHAACWWSDLEMIKLLVEEFECRADQHCLSLLTTSPIQSDRVKETAYLLANGSNAMDVIDSKSGDTPLHRAYNMDLAKLLLSQCTHKKEIYAMLKAKNNKGETARQAFSRKAEDSTSRKCPSTLFRYETVAFFLKEVEDRLISSIPFDRANYTQMTTTLVYLIFGSARTAFTDMQYLLPAEVLREHVFLFLTPLDIC